MTTPAKWPVAIIGSGNFGTDLMIKILCGDGPLAMAAMAGTDPESGGLSHAERLGVACTAGGIDGLLAMPNFADIKVVFDATSAGVHRANWAKLEGTGVRVIDLTPAALGPYCVPVVNLDDHLEARNLNMVTYGGQATVPIVAAVGQVGVVSYAETVSSISSKSVGRGARANIDEFIETTSAALEVVGGAQRGRALVVLNPANPPVVMRNTVYCLVDGEVDHFAIERSVEAMVEQVRNYVPGYRLKQRVQFDACTAANPLFIPETGKFTGTRVTVLVEVAGAGHYLPAYAGNLDIMTSAAKATAERIADRASQTAGART